MTSAHPKPGPRDCAGTSRAFPTARGSTSGTTVMPGDPVARTPVPGPGAAVREGDPCKPARAAFGLSSKSKVGLPNVIGTGQSGGFPGHRHSTCLKDVGAVGEVERGLQVLLNEE